MWYQLKGIHSYTIYIPSMQSIQSIGIMRFTLIVFLSTLIFFCENSTTNIIEKGCLFPYIINASLCCNNTYIRWHLFKYRQYYMLCIHQFYYSMYVTYLSEKFSYKTEKESLKIYFSKKKSTRILIYDNLLELFFDIVIYMPWIKGKKRFTIFLRVVWLLFFSIHCFFSSRHRIFIYILGYLYTIYDRSNW